MIRRVMRRRAALACVVTGACGFSAPRGAGPDGEVAPGDGGAIDDGLIAWYRMDQLVDAAEDATGHGHLGTCTSCPEVVPGRIGSGFRFGGNVRIDVASAADLRLTSGFTVALWLSFDVIPTSEYACAVNQLLSGTVFNTWQLCYRMSTKSWFFGTQTSSGFNALEKSESPVAGTWYHMAISWDGNIKQLWLNGSKIDEDTARGIVFDDEAIAIGADIDNNTHLHAFPGILDDVRIYNRALNEPEIMRLANP
jgi:hypothetical protein